MSSGRTAQVKNKAPAPVQITAEQLLREAQEFKEDTIVPPTQQITDPEELKEYRGRRRKEFEDGLRRSRHNMGLWIKYAQFEAKLKEWDRARSVFERALDVDYQNQSLWLKYADMEMTNKFVQHARNIWDRAVTLLPRVDQFWYKYAYMEEMLGEVGNARQIFERWMTFHPDKQAWYSYIKLEIRHKNYDKARSIFERFTLDHLSVDSYLKYAKFEQRYGSVENTRKVFERALDELGEDADNEALFVAFANFETQQREYERARTIYQFSLDHLPKSAALKIYNQYISFEKQYGDKEGVELVILSKRRFQYEEEIKNNPFNYDVWFDYVRLEEARGKVINNVERCREIYERAISFLPPVQEKRYWKRYIYLWIHYVIYEELTTKDIERTRSIYHKLLQQVIPHQVFTFAKAWLLYAHFEIRQGKLDAARKILGQAIGMCPGKKKLYLGYIELEMSLGEMTHVRKLYEKYVESSPVNVEAWLAYANFEINLQEFSRARALFKLAVKQPVLDRPELLWKSYIDLEISLKNVDEVHTLYSSLLEKTKHVKVWISYAQFAATLIQTPNEQQDDIHRKKTREIFTKAEEYFKSQDNAKEERLLLLQSWRQFERTYGTSQSIDTITKRLPQQVKKRRPILDASGQPTNQFEEYYDYIFPEEAAAKVGGLKIMELARMWKKQELLKKTEEEEQPGGTTNSAAASTSSTMAD